MRSPPPTHTIRPKIHEDVEITALIGSLLGEINVEADFLDTIMRNNDELQPEKLHAWESLSRVEDGLWELVGSLLK